MIGRTIGQTRISGHAWVAVTPLAIDQAL